MTLNHTLPPSGARRGSVVLHVLKRIALVLLAYIAAVLVTLIAIVVIYSVLSNLPGAPAYFDAFNFTPIIALVVPWIGVFVYLVAVVVSAVPTLLAAIVTEGLALRQVWLHAILGAAVSAASFSWLNPMFLEGGIAPGLDDTVIVAAAGVFGGLIYWLVAGRGAGIVPGDR